MAINKKGILGEKLGMTQVWDENNRVVPVTVVKAGPCVVTQVRTPENDGYSGVQIAFGQIDPRKVTQPMLGHFAKAGVTPRRHLLELRFDDASDYALGTKTTASQVPSELVQHRVVFSRAFECQVVWVESLRQHRT